MFSGIRQRLSMKVALLVLGISLVVFTGLALVNASWQEENFRESLGQAITENSELLFHAIEKPMVIGDDSGTREQFSFIAEHYPHIKVYITSFRGNVTYSTQAQAERQDMDTLYSDPALMGMSKAALSGGNVETRLMDLGKDPVFVHSRSIPNDPSCHHCHGASQKVLGQLLLVQDVSPQMAAMSSQLRNIGFLGVAGLIVMVGGVLLFLRSQVLQKVQHITETTARVSQGDLDAAFLIESEDELGQLSGHIGTMLDRLKEQLAFSDGVLKGVTVPCAITNPDNTIRYTNAAMCTYLEKSHGPEQYVGVTSGEFFFGDPAAETISHRAIVEQKQIEEESVLQLPSGRTIHTAVTSTPFYDQQGNLLGTLAIWFDLTGIRQQEQQLVSQRDTITQAAGDADAVSNNVAAAAEELSAQVEQASKGSEQQKIRTSEVATAMEEMNATVLEVAQNAGAAAELAEQVRQSARDGNSAVGESVEMANAVTEKVEVLRGSMGDLELRANEVGDVITVIQDIADQTNLLALNAAIEAARAGEAGRGFAVVADEVRKLAERTMQATREVTDSIRQIQESAQKNVRGTYDAAELVAKNKHVSQKSGEILSQITKLIDGTADQVSAIATAAEQQSATSEEIARATESVNSIASETSLAMNESSQAVADLAQLAQQLRNIIEDMQSNG